MRDLGPPSMGVAQRAGGVLYPLVTIRRPRQNTLTNFKRDLPDPYARMQGLFIKEGWDE